MKKPLILLIILITNVSCKQKQETKVAEKELSIAEKIANAHGYENWKKVSEIAFNFNEKRSWIWHPKTNEVTLITDNDTINYNRKSIDSISKNADKGFVNDKFWLLIPFQLVWDAGATISEPVKTEAPISKIEMNKITLTYSNEGGYTPGDAYDIYYNNNYIIKEWAFRRGNKPEASLVNTFENYQDFNGIKIALEHKKAEGDWNLKFTDVKVTLD
ncbi:hypothetical protein VP395_04475 [Mariniflexile soesokkakense]|uniref:Uncharacterized protein n=1 Tax=Mariniflexile soesokkakense TaxID=1343160 RepID=A0ABV0A7I1_9FLAO